MITGHKLFLPTCNRRAAVPSIPSHRKTHPKKEDRAAGSRSSGVSTCLPAYLTHTSCVPQISYLPELKLRKNYPLPRQLPVRPPALVQKRGARDSGKTNKMNRAITYFRLLLLLLPTPLVGLSEVAAAAAAAAAPRVVPARSALASWRRRFRPARMVATRASICLRSFSFSCGGEGVRKNKNL